MKTKGLCVTCASNARCVLTKAAGVLECEEFLTAKTSVLSKANCAKKKACVGVDSAEAQEE